jgi:hypothetical protein
LLYVNVTNKRFNENGITFFFVQKKFSLIGIFDIQCFWSS